MQRPPLRRGSGYTRIPPSDEFDDFHTALSGDTLESLEPWSWDE